ncbi:hypothetical protein [Actinoplanes auranticolor]|uniref:Uncharacterized protein n=1 Tax=Actinoplanes auranticolor TaxID=47988 RepID=A0A919SYY0_9ACTN|nr:hypothetical protein [Actinoplanes auranticolor]GIM80594.1 hypothetical protein Aau02nite_91260 [Actinoplanes auranticolor]
MELPTAMIIAVDQVSRQFAECAPDAPAQPHVERSPEARRVRVALARGLIRLAHVIAPPEPACR